MRLFFLGIATTCFWGNVNAQVVNKPNDEKEIIPVIVNSEEEKTAAEIEKTVDYWNQIPTDRLVFVREYKRTLDVFNAIDKQIRESIYQIEQLKKKDTLESR